MDFAIRYILSCGISFGGNHFFLALAFVPLAYLPIFGCLWCRKLLLHNSGYNNLESRTSLMSESLLREITNNIYKNLGESCAENKTHPKVRYAF